LGKTTSISIIFIVALAISKIMICLILSCFSWMYFTTRQRAMCIIHLSSL